MKNKLFIVLLVLVSLFTLQVEAKSLPGFYAGSDVSLKKRIDATLFAAGQTVDIKSEVNGASFIAGQDVTISSTQDVLFAAGQDVELKDVNTKDAFVSGETLTVKDSVIRDLFIAGDKVVIDSNISRNLNIAADTVKINKTIDGDVYISADKIILGEAAIINGTMRYPKNAKLKQPKTAIIHKKKAYSSASVKTSGNSLKSKIIDKVLSLLSILLIGMILMFIYNKLFKDIEKIEFDAERIFKNIFIGLLVLIVIPIIAILLLISTIGLPLSLIMIPLYIIFIYLSTIPTSFYIGNKLFKDKISNKYLLLALSITCLFVIELIPVVGGIVTMLSLCLGLGLYYSVIVPNLTIGKKY